MTAFDDILKAEQEAEQAIASATNESTDALQKARADQQDKIKQVETELLAEATQATKKEETRVAELTKQIRDDVQSQIQAFEKNFQGKKEVVKEAIKQRFQ